MGTLVSKQFKNLEILPLAPLKITCVRFRLSAQVDFLDHITGFNHFVTGVSCGYSDFWDPICRPLSPEVLNRACLRRHLITLPNRHLIFGWEWSLAPNMAKSTCQGDLATFDSNHSL